jgi:hypothetical protein
MGPPTFAAVSQEADVSHIAGIDGPVREAKARGVRVDGTPSMSTTLAGANELPGVHCWIHCGPPDSSPHLCGSARGFGMQ